MLTILLAAVAAAGVVGAPSSYDNEQDDALNTVDKRWNCEPHVCASHPDADLWVELLCGGVDPSKRSTLELDVRSRLGNCSPYVCAGGIDGKEWVERFCDAGSPSKRDADTPGGLELPASNPFVMHKNLPDNVPDDFWDSQDSPAEHANVSDYLMYEFLHCSSPLYSGETMVNGDCNYMAGAVARGSELHLYMRNTKSLFGTCDLADNIRGWHPDITWDSHPTSGAILKNGLCQYSIEYTIDFLKITN